MSSKKYMGRSTARQSSVQEQSTQARMQLGKILQPAAEIPASLQAAQGSTRIDDLSGPILRRSSRSSVLWGDSQFRVSSAPLQSRPCSGHNLVRWIERGRRRRGLPCRVTGLRIANLQLVRTLRNSNVMPVLQVHLVPQL